MMSDDDSSRRLTIAEFAARSAERADLYHRYHIDTVETKDVQPLPNRFMVKVGKAGLAKFLFKEITVFKMILEQRIDPIHLRKRKSVPWRIFSIMCLMETTCCMPE